MNKEELNAMTEEQVSEYLRDCVATLKVLNDMGSSKYEQVHHDYLKDISVVVDVNSSLRMDDGENYNLNAFMWSEMRDWLETASLPPDPELRTDLTGRRYFYRGGLLMLESKDDMKKRGLKSPDRGDSLALTFAIPGGAKQKKRIPTSQVPVSEPDAYTGF